MLGFLSGLGACLPGGGFCHLVNSADSLQVHISRGGKYDCLVVLLVARRRDTTLLVLGTGYCWVRQQVGR